MSADPGFGPTRRVSIEALVCGACDKPLVPYKSVPRTKGATPHLYLICDGCTGGVIFRVRDNQLTWTEIATADLEDE